MPKIWFLGLVMAVIPWGYVFDLEGLLVQTLGLGIVIGSGIKWKWN